MKINLVSPYGELREVKIGFSWTVFFFGFLVPIFRGDVKWTVIMFVASVLTAFLAQLVFCFVYNGIYVRELLGRGFKPADSYSKSVLIAKRYIAA